MKQTGMDNAHGGPSRRAFWVWLTLGYGLLLGYGTLYPFDHWQTLPYDVWERLFARGLRTASRADMLTNLLIYIPLGLFGVRAMGSRPNGVVWVLLVTLAGGLLSVSLEYAQAFIPERVASLLDMLLNTLGTMIGALLALMLHHQTRAGRRLAQWYQDYVEPGPRGNLGLLVLVLWALSQLTPLVPSLDLENLYSGVKPLWLGLQGKLAFDPAKAVVYGLGIAGIALLAAQVLRPHRRGILIAGFVFSVLLLKVPVLDRVLSPEALVGLLTGLFVAAVFRRVPPRPSALIAAAAVLGAVLVGAIQSAPEVGSGTRVFNWIPFYGHLSHVLSGLANILEGLWPFVALNLALQLATRGAPNLLLRVAGGVAVLLLMFSLEWYQQLLPGRYPDITDVLIALIGWSLPWLHPALDLSRVSANGRSAAGPVRGRSRLLLRLAFAALVVTTICLGYLLSGSGFSLRPLQAADGERVLPAPSELPPIKLSDFRFDHPRLPFPDPLEVEQLRRDNPGYLKAQLRRAKGGKGDFYAAVLSAVTAPGSQDLDLLHRRLMAMKLGWRGGEQGKSLALAYDWLYDQWSVDQRRLLRRKLFDVIEYIIQRLRIKNRWSPYNVHLYNRPFQGLMAATLALYGDGPEGDLPMRFTYDYWKHRVLPVWRQIMGHNGGWHEGGEYVGFSVGQAVYQLPAMWRSATGEDLFETEPGICGFLDFLVHRTRPDGKDFRWGDAAFFDKGSPDRLPLAIECGHAAAYALHGCPETVKPSGWPWGPLTDDAHCLPEASQGLPPAQFFDGIGLLALRSDWGPDATYVTFKAGDNYWSHSHLDQGAFTIYKGGALAIDSGLYGPGYGSDHHMNYTYQTIAHNLVTVVDPEDRVPGPGKDPRPIANDGGQRRIGSGWGLGSAPLDLDEWQEAYSTYHTAEIRKLLHQGDLTVAVADLTPAYTNEHSGSGEFSSRTRRVERFTRTFAYDRADDVILIHDAVTSTDPDFPKRWLLHTIEAPTQTADGFVVDIAPTAAPGHRGGRLQGHVILPRQRNIHFLGGPGFEYFVDGRNYDEGGKVRATAMKRKDFETGAWRVEVTPLYAARDDVFLVVLLPTLGDDEPPHQVRRLEEGDRYGVEIVGPHHTTRWWFEPDRDGPLVEIDDAGRTRTEDLRVARIQPPPRSEQGLLSWIRGWFH